MTTQGVGTRREQNKLATKQAIVDAVAQLLKQGPSTALTANEIADSAGISRRTLFNYFPTVDAIFSYPLHQLLDAMVDSLAEPSETITLLDSILQGLKSDEVAQLLGQVAYFGVYLCADDANIYHPANGNEWQQATNDLYSKVVARYPQVDSFAVRVLTHSVLGAGQAAFEQWLEQLPASVSDNMDISDDLIAAFHALVTKAMNTLDQGFALLPINSTSTSTPKGI